MAPAFALLIWLVSATLTGAHAASPASTPVLVVDPIPAAIVGDRPVVIAHLTTLGGEPVVDVTLTLSIGTQVESRARTVDNGTAVLLVRSYPPAGTHTVEVSFGGSLEKNLDPVSVTAPLDIRPGSVTVQMVPVMAGVEVRMTPVADDGASNGEAGDALTVFSDIDGFAQFDIDTSGTYLIELVLPWVSPEDGIRGEFARWGDNEYETFREIRYRNGSVYQAGFELYYEISYQFTDLQGIPIAPDEITSITIKNSIGEHITRETHDSLWVKGGRVTRRAGGLEETRLLYSIEEVMVDGTNVVNRAQLSFFPAETRSWTLPLLYYSMTFSSIDAIFGFPIGDAIELVSPAGIVREIPLDASGEAALSHLPRGEYQVRVLGAGFSPSTPVMLSRDQAVQLKVISLWDGAFVVVLGLTVALGLLAFGRLRTRGDQVLSPRGQPHPRMP